MVIIRIEVIFRGMYATQKHAIFHHKLIVLIHTVLSEIYLYVLSWFIIRLLIKKRNDNLGSVWKTRSIDKWGIFHDMASNSNLKIKNKKKKISLSVNTKTRRQAFTRTPVNGNRLQFLFFFFLFSGIFQVFISPTNLFVIIWPIWPTLFWFPREHNYTISSTSWWF